MLETKFQPIAEISKVEFVGISFDVQYIFMPLFCLSFDLCILKSTQSGQDKGVTGASLMTMLVFRFESK